MSATHEIISVLVAGGMDPVEAASLVARAAVEMTAREGKSSNAIRQQRYRDRNKASRSDGDVGNESVTNRNETVTRNADENNDQTVTKRNEALQSVTRNADENNDQTVTKRNEALQSVTSDNTPLSSFKKEDLRKRGARLPIDWSPSDADREFARQLGWSDAQIDAEAANFRDYWIAKPGSGGCKLDWPATWRKWIRNSKVKPVGHPKGSAPAGRGGFYVRFGSLEQEAWDAYGMSSNGRTYPRDREGGWEQPTRWPPGYEHNIIASVETLAGVTGRRQ